MATIRACLAASKLFNNAVKSCVMYKVTRSVFPRPRSDENVAMLKEIARRKVKFGPIKHAHRNTYLEWNHPAELYAFSKRIGEDFVGNTLERAFTRKSYVLQQESLYKELNIDDPKRFLEDNQLLSEKGELLARNFVARYLRTALPYLPEERIQYLREYLLREDNVADILSGIGGEELILCTDFPAETQTKVSTLYAIIGAIEESNGPERGSLFVRDFIIASLSGQDIQGLCFPESSFKVLSDIYLREGKGSLEPRIIAQAGINSVIPSYRIGLYAEKKHIASGDGESLEIAVDNAALKALWNLWGLPDGKYQFPYDLDVSRVLANNQSNVPESLWTSGKASQSTSVSR